MYHYNPNSNRKNPFREIYNSTNIRDNHNPHFIDIELTNRCNLKCKMCSRNLMKRNMGFISDKTFQLILDECSIYNIPIRFIRWGEPFLHPKILKYIKEVKDARLPLHITTNGLMVTTKHMKRLIELELDSIIFSMQGLNKQEYQEIRGDYYDKLESNILKLIELRGNNDKPYIHISTTRTHSSDATKFIEYWGDKVDSIGIGITTWARIDDESSTPCKYHKCKEIYQKLSVDWDGKVTACCEDYDNLLYIGDISDTLHHIWNNSPQLKAFRCILDNMQHKSLTLCKDCVHTYEEF